MTQELIAITKRGAEVTVQEIHEMYDVRAHFMRLKSSINPQEDFQNFATWEKWIQKSYGRKLLKIYAKNMCL